TMGAKFSIPQNVLIEEVDLSGSISISSSGFSGELSYNGDFENPLIALNHELLSLRLTSVNINLQSGFSNMDLQVKFFNADDILSFPNLSFTDLELSLPLNLSCNQNIPLMPNSRLLELIIGRVSGLASINLTNGDFDFDVLINTALKMPYAGSPERYPELSLRLNKDSGLSVENINLNLNQNLKLNFDYLQLGLADLQIPQIAYQNNQFDFQIQFDADLDIPALNEVNFPIIQDIQISNNGISIGEQVFSNLNLTPLEFAGFRLALNSFTVGETSFNWFSGEMPDWNFSIDADLSFPNFPAEYGDILRHTIIPLNGINIGSAQWQTALPEITFHENQAEIPLGSGAAFYVDSFSGMLDINLTGGNFINNSRLDILGRLQMPDFFSCENAENVNTALHLDGFGHVFGTVENFIPSCPLELGFISLTVNNSTLEFSFENDEQKAILSGQVTAHLPGIAGEEATATGNISIDLITGEVLHADIQMENFVLNLPAENPVLSFNIELARITKDGILIHGTNQLNLGNSNVGVVFDSLMFNPVTMSVVSGQAFFNSSFAFKIGIDEGNLNWLAVQAGTVLEEANSLLMNLPDNISLSSSGISFSGSAVLDLNYSGQSLGDLQVNFTDNFSLQFSPFGISLGQADIFYEANRIAYLDAGGI
ncbi:MAG: hypothetical protein KAR38_07580, partial [Calditrichia bacterium]|nr:hypothetical protein [Calditrichia bacterium]